MTIPVLTAMSVVFYSLFAVFLSRMGGKINTNLGSTIFMAIGTLIPLIYYLYERSSKQVIIATTSSGVWYAILAGVAIAIWNAVVITVFAKGGNTSHLFPITYGLGAIAVPSIIGWLLFKETITATQAIGLMVILFGIGIIVFSKNG